MSQISSNINVQHAYTADMQGVSSQAWQISRSMQSRAPEGSRITDVVKHVEVKPAPLPRRILTMAARVAVSVTRLATSIVTLGISEKVISFADRILQGRLERNDPWAAKFNAFINKLLKDDLCAKAPTYHSAVNEAVDQLRDVFGEELPEKVHKLKDICQDSKFKTAVSYGIKVLTGQITPGQLKDLIVEKAKSVFSEKVTEKALDAAFKKLGLSESAQKQVKEFLNDKPDLKKALKKIGAKALEPATKEIDDFARKLLLKAINTIESKAHIVAEAAEKLAHENGIEVARVKEYVDYVDLEQIWHAGADKVKEGKGMDEVKDELKLAVEFFLENKIHRLLDKLEKSF